MNKPAFLLLFFIFPAILFSQTISNVRTRQEGSTFYIKYDLNSPVPVDISVVCSTDGGATWSSPLEGVSGQVGKSIRSGNDLEIKWMVFKDFNTLISENLVFKINASAQKYGQLVDVRDNQTYRTVQIGNQTWMADNLNYEMQGCCCYDDNPSNCKNYGKLYKWKTATKACPIGWRLPSENDWDKLIDFAGGADIAGERLVKDERIGFNAKLCGYRGMSGNFNEMGRNTTFWTAGDDGGLNAYYREITNSSMRVVRHYYDKTYFLSVRCIKND